MPPPAPTDPNLPIKHIYKVDARQGQEIELYHAASTVRRKIDQSSPEAHTYLNLLEDYINGAITQYHRIQEDYNLMANAFVEIRQHAFDDSRFWQDKLWDTQLTLLLDIHFYLICLDKVQKLYIRFRKSIEHPLKGAESQHRWRCVRRRFEQALSPVKDARGFLEHIDNVVGGGFFDGLSWETNEIGTTFIYTKRNSDEKHFLNINGLKRITEAYEALIEMLHSLPDLD